MTSPPTVAFFPEASFGAALNCVGIARALVERGARPVFICHAGFSGVFADYGFQEYQLPRIGGPAPRTIGRDSSAATFRISTCRRPTRSRPMSPRHGRRSSTLRFRPKHR